MKLHLTALRFASYKVTHRAPQLSNDCNSTYTSILHVHVAKLTIRLLCQSKTSNIILRVCHTDPTYYTYIQKPYSNHICKKSLFRLYCTGYFCLILVLRDHGGLIHFECFVYLPIRKKIKPIYAHVS